MIRSPLPDALVPPSGVAAAGRTIARIATRMKTAVVAPLTSHRVERPTAALSLPSQQAPCATAPGKAQAVGGGNDRGATQRLRREDALRVLSPPPPPPALLGGPRAAAVKPSEMCS